MKIVVFGASGLTGGEIIKQTLAQGHEVTAFVRDPAKMSSEQEKWSGADHLQLVSGDVLDYATVRPAIQGQEAVICSLGSNSLGKTTVRSEGTANIVKAMEEEQVDRLLVVSAMGVGESWSTLSFINKLFFATVLRSSRADHEAQELAVKNSNLKWTIVRPSGLTDGAKTGSYAIGENIEAESSRIARADVAHAIITELDEDAFVQKAITVTN